MAVTKVFVVEDESLVILNLKRQSILRGYTVPGIATTGKDALRVAAKTAP